MNGHDVAIDRVSEHRFGAPAPQALGCASICMLLSSMPFTDVGADRGSGPDDPHPAGVTGHSPLTFMDADLTSAAASARV